MKKVCMVGDCCANGKGREGKGRVGGGGGRGSAGRGNARNGRRDDDNTSIDGDIMAKKISFYKM